MNVEVRATTLLEALEASSDHPGQGWVFHLREGETPFTHAELLEGGIARARVLAAQGAGPGDTVGVLGPNLPDWLMWAAAAWMAGGVLAPISFPLRIRDPQIFSENVATMMDAIDCRLVAAHPKYVSMVREDRVVSWDIPLAAAGGTVDAQPGGPDDPAVVQFTSGSTARPKAAVLTNRAVLAGIRSIVARCGLLPGTDGLGWLPFFHDFGLFGQALMGMVVPGTGHMLPTERFASNPGLWFKLASDLRTRVTCGPSSAWGMALRGASRRPEGIDLSGLEMAIFGAETIDPGVVDGLTREGPAMGLRPEALAGGYGMAEAMLGLTCAPIGTGIRIDRLDLAELASTGRAVPAASGPAKRIASCGTPLDGVELRIVGPEGPVGDRQVGEIQAKAPSLMLEYRGPDAPDPFDDGWLKTGDQGYLVGDELFVTGRIKDIVIVTGKNYLPDDLEWAVSRIEEMRLGRSVAFNPPGEDGHVVVAVELAGTTDPGDVPREVRGAVLNATGVNPRTIVVLPKGSIPRTTSGKVRRAAVREAWATGELEAMSVITDPVQGGPPSQSNGDRSDEEGVPG